MSQARSSWSARPEGEPKATDFEVRELDDGEPADGEVLVRNVFVSVDPYMRGRMTGVRTYVPPYELGDVINGGVGRAGRRVEGCSLRRGRLGAARCSAGARAELRRATASLRSTPQSRRRRPSLGVLGMPAFTAWIGLDEIGRIAEGETVFVSGAAGAVGSAAAQIALLRGCRVIGSAGSRREGRRGSGRWASRRSTTAPPT